MEIVKVVAQKKGHLIVDEIYQGLVYGVDDYTALSVSDDCFVINSFSKYFGMTGWRIGWMVVPEFYIDAIDRIAQNIFLAPPTVSQYAALAALSSETQVLLDERRDAFKQRRDFLLPALEQLGFKIAAKPQGAFYIYANCEKFTDDSFGWVKRLLNEQGVALTPGIDFGSHQANIHCRFAYTQSLEILEQAADKIDAFIRKKFGTIKNKNMIGNIKKMQAVLGAPESGQPVQYRLPIGDELVAMNEHIGQTIKLHYKDEINCVACGRKTKKSFGQGHCYPCFRSLASCDMCIMKPET